MFQLANVDLEVLTLLVSVEVTEGKKNKTVHPSCILQRLKLARPANPHHCSVSWGAMLRMLVEARRLGASVRTEPMRPPLRVHPVPPRRPPDRDHGAGRGCGVRCRPCAPEQPINVSETKYPRAVGIFLCLFFHVRGLRGSVVREAGGGIACRRFDFCRL